MKKLVALALQRMAVSRLLAFLLQLLSQRMILRMQQSVYSLVQPVILKLVNMRLTGQLLSVTAKEAKQSRHLWPVRSTV